MKKITFLKSTMLAFTLMFFSFSFSQERTCGMEAYMEEQMKDPEFARQHQEMQAQFKIEVEKMLKNGNVQQRGGVNPLVIPVAVHFPTGNEANRACLEALAQNQIDILNADYTATNADISNWNAASIFYPNTDTGSSDIYFCLATLNHPAGTDAQLVEGGPAVTIGYNFGNGGDVDANWSGYMNFLVKPIGGLLGYSPLGGSIAAGQAVVMNTSAFGSGPGCTGFVPGAPYNLGRTVTHELGHFYSLNHTFNGDGNGVCGAGGDGIADTPEVANSTYGCPTNGSVNGCVAGTKSLTMNFMDYTNDACMYMFSEGQAAITTAYLNVLQAQFKPNVTECSFGPGFSITSATTSIDACPSVGSVEFNFSYNIFEGFNETTTFTVTGLPAGTSAVFTPTSLNTAGSFTMVISNLQSVPLGDYDITVTGTSPSLTDSIDVELSIVNGLCPSAGTMQYQTSVRRVTFNTIDNATGKTAGYNNYTATSTDVNRESSYPLTVNVNTDGNYQVLTKVWVDWNQNCSFNDPGEEYDLGMAANVANGPTGNSPLSIIIPTDAELGSTTMRVTAKYTDPNAGQYPTSCQIGLDGEVEDYSLNVLTSLSTDEFELAGFNIFPNPNNGEFTIKLNSNSGDDIKVNVYDIRGRVIFNNVYSNTPDFTQTINLNNVQSGMYLVNVNDGRGQVTKKIIVE
jgi:hypothetical protein